MDIIPYDKYWLYTLGILDLLHDYDDIYSFLDSGPMLINFWFFKKYLIC